jgi:hypothetical protein
MRINLKTPFADKDAAKALGARWDGAKKVWYITDVDDLTPFMRWIPDLAEATQKTPTVPDGAANGALQASAGKSAGVITKPTKALSHCGCAVLPWEDCAHTS